MSRPSFTGPVLCERRLWASGERRGSPVGVRVPEPRCVFLPWVAGRQCWSSCCCFWPPPPPPPPRRPSRRGTRLVVRREGAGTSGRGRGRPGEGAGEGGSGWLRPAVAVLEPAEGAETGSLVSMCAKRNGGFRFHSLTLLSSPSKLLLTVCFLRK